MPNNTRAGGELPSPDPAFKEPPRAVHDLQLSVSRRRGDNHEKFVVIARGWSGVLLLGLIIALGGVLLLGGLLR